MYHARTLGCVALLCLALLGLTACRPAQTITLPPTPPAPPTPTPSPLPTATSRPASTVDPTPTQPPAERYQGWQTFTHPTYGFSLRYPAGWLLEEDQRAVSTTKGHWLKIWSPQEPRMTVNVGYKRAGEDQRITRSGLGAGELQERDAIAFLDQDVRRQVLVCQGYAMTVLYGPGEIPRKRLAFTLALDYSGDWCAAPGLPDAAQASADAIVASFTIP